MTVARATAALLSIWLALGGMVEVSAYHGRELARQQRTQAVAESNAAKLMRFVDGCLRGEPSPLDDLIYDCRDVRLMRLPASAVRQELLVMARSKPCGQPRSKRQLGAERMNDVAEYC